MTVTDDIARSLELAVEYKIPVWFQTKDDKETFGPYLPKWVDRYKGYVNLRAKDGAVTSLQLTNIAAVIIKQPTTEREVLEELEEAVRAYRRLVCSLGFEAAEYTRLTEVMAKARRVLGKCG